MSEYVGALAAGFALLAVVVTAIVVVFASGMNTRLNNLQGTNADLRAELEDEKRRATTAEKDRETEKALALATLEKHDALAKAAAEAYEVKVKALQDRVTVLENTVTGKDAIEGLTVAMVEAERLRHQEHMDQQAALRDGLAALVKAIHDHEHNAQARAERVGMRRASDAEDAPRPRRYYEHATGDDDGAV